MMTLKRGQSKRHKVHQMDREEDKCIRKKLQKEDIISTRTNRIEIGKNGDRFFTSGRVDGGGKAFTRTVFGTRINFSFGLTGNMDSTRN